MKRKEWMEILKKNRESAGKTAGKADAKKTPPPKKEE